MDTLNYNDGYIKFVGYLMELTDELKDTINKEQINKLKMAYNKLRFVAQSSKAEISYKLFEPFKSMGSISVKGNRIDIYNVQSFIDAAKLADNFHIWSNSDAIYIEFAFSNLVK